MAHFAELDDNNVVIRVLVTDDAKSNEGYNWLIETFGGRWVKASYNTRGGVHVLGGTPFRKNFPGIGYVYDEERDAFIEPKPFPSWVLDEEKCLYAPPTPYPTDGRVYRWYEEQGGWVDITDKE